MLKLRPGQIEVYEFEGGRMGVSAVPGSGKTTTLSCLAAKLISGGYLEPGQEVLVVTLVNSAVKNFKKKIGELLAAQHLLPGQGYRVRTLHGLAHDIVRERPDLAGVSNQFKIVDEVEAERILHSVAENWLRAHPEFIEEWSNTERADANGPRTGGEWSRLVIDISRAFIRRAKDLEASVETVRNRLEDLRGNFPLMDMGLEIYQEYQRALSFRSAVDFDDLIRCALEAMRCDESLLARLRERWPYVLEDEAQDSSRLQEHILQKLVGDMGNWVRVGDPNQAIYDTFTTADPKHLRDFLQAPGVIQVPMPNSGRSTRSIIDLANTLIEWTMNDHVVEGLRTALTPPYIQPTGPGDPQPNPADNPNGIYIRPPGQPYTPDEELSVVTRSLKKWLETHPNDTVAVLDSQNKRGGELADALKKQGIKVVEMLRSPASIRTVAEILMHALRSLDDPGSKDKLLHLYRDRYRDELKPEQPDAPIHEAAMALLRNCARLEDYLYPADEEHDWLLTVRPTAPDAAERLEVFAKLLRRWQEAALLPADQLILTLAQDLFTSSSDVRDSYDLALLVEMLSHAHPEFELLDYAAELEKVFHNQRQVRGHGDDEDMENADKQVGKVIVSTIHKAKGLEWDRVYLMSVNNYDFPSAQPNDMYRSERWFVRGNLNLEAETLAQLEALLNDPAPDLPALYLPYGQATVEARLKYCAERLRLLYVGITRARKELSITWNTGRNGDLRLALPAVHLQAQLEGSRDAREE